MTKLVRSKKRKSGKKIALSPLDKLYSDFIRARDNWTCQRCKKFFPSGPAEGKAQGLDCSHIFGRRHRSVRWHPLNGKALCTSCHAWYHANPTESGRWVADEYLGPEKYAELVRLKNEIVKDNEAYRQEQKARLQELMSEVS